MKISNIFNIGNTNKCQDLWKIYKSHIFRTNIGCDFEQRNILKSVLFFILHVQRTHIFIFLGLEILKTKFSINVLHVKIYLKLGNHTF